MCLICVEWQLGKLTFDEAFRNLNEIKEEDPEHYDEVVALLLEEDDTL